MNKYTPEEQAFINGDTTNSFSDIVKTLQKDDINAQASMFRELLDLEVESRVGQLRHRALMMRQRANEFDEIADGFLKQKSKVIDSTVAIESSLAHILDLIDRHSFIQPSKVQE